ncbi:MAG: hypothetical protein ACRD4H_09820, partial [Candidatus Acidiferrales bacterium]
MKTKFLFVVILAVFFVELARATNNAKTESQPYLSEAVAAAHWIEGTAITTKDGLVWPDDP